MPLESESYWLVRFLFQRGLALLYLLAFLVAANQFRPLAGEDGIFPLGEFAERASFREHPSLFLVFPSDRAIGVAAWTGVAISAVLLFAGPYWLPPGYALPVSMALWALLWGLYLSFVEAGRLFYGYGWESMLLETGFLAIFLGAGASGPPVVVLWLLKWLLFRNMFGAGLIKLRGDRCWRDLTCMDYHYQTQPIPNPLSWYAHHLPDWFHRYEVLGNHVAELAVPFLLLAPQPYASIGGVAIVAFQGWLLLTGNFSWLNALTIVQGIAAFSDRALAAVLPESAIAPLLTAFPSMPAGEGVAGQAGAGEVAAGEATAGDVAAGTFVPAVDPPLALSIAALAVATIVVALSYNPVRNVLSERQAMNTGFDPLHLVNSYGAFGSITRDRHEIVVEGTTAEDPGPEADWRTFRFRGKPTDPERRPPQVAPYHLRLDWQLWFAAMRPSPRGRSRWFLRFLGKLLDGDDGVRELLADDPFDGEAPTYVRAHRYRYRYTTPEERAETGRWWERERVGTYVRPLSRDDASRAGRRGVGPGGPFG